MKAIELARLNSFVKMDKQPGKKSAALTKYEKGKVYQMTDKRADAMLQLTDDQDIPVFRISKNKTAAQFPVTQDAEAIKVEEAPALEAGDKVEV